MRVATPAGVDGNAERDLLRRLFDAMPQLGWTAQPDGFIDYYNRGWFEFTGTTYEEMKGWGWRSVHDPEVLPRVMETWTRCIATGKPWELEFPLRRHDGVFRWFLSRATPIYDDAGTLVRWVGINTDIDDQKRAERQLAELARARTVFFSNVSHELRTPLTLILAPIEEALQSGSGTLSGATLEVTHRNAVRLLKLVNTLLDFSRIEAGRVEATFVETDLAALTRDLASAFQSAVEGAGLAFEVDCAAIEGAVYVDHDQWEKVVLNLLSNALKFTFAGSIRVALRQVADRVDLSVTDTGTGIAADELPHVFERFRRVAGVRSRSHEGSGIGLALVSEIARMHGGTVRATSAPGQGSTFTVSIPLGCAHLPSAQVGATRAPSQAAVVASPYVQEALRWLPGAVVSPAIESDLTRPVDDPVAGARIVIADDNADMREYLARLLGARWRVEAVADGAAALAASLRHPPDLVLTDVMMPELDGFGLLRGLRGDARTRAVPVIMLSARAGEDARIEGLEVGVDDYLVKPFSARELVARVAAQIQIARLRTAASAEREKLYQLFVYSPVPVILFVGPEHRYEFVSPSFCEMVGRGDLIGKTVREAFPDLPPDHPSIGVLDRAYATGETVGVDEMYAPLRVDGGTTLQDRWFTYVARPLPGEAGGTAGLMVVAIEVTAQVVARNAVEAARQEAERYRELLATAQRAAHIGIFDWDLRAQKVYWSPELFSLMGLRPGEIEPTPERWNERLHPEDMAQGLEDFRRAVAAGATTHESERRMMVSDGATRWIRINYHIVYDAQAEPVRVTGAVVDIQNLKELATRERLARLEAEEANGAKDDFLAMLGHELRNPLSPILTALQLIRLRGGEGIPREVSVIERQTHHLIRLVDDLLDVSRVARGKVALAREVVEIADVIAAAIETASPAIETGRHALVVDVPRPGLVVDVDRIRMTQVVVNLLTNAARYSPAGGRICVSARRVDDEVVVQVEDSGTGISPELLPRIFGMFVQARQTLARSQGGLGLGLTIVKSLVTMHGGTVTADSRGLGHGSVFTVRLPAADHRPFPRLASTPPPPNEPRRLRVLVVDDNEDAAEMLAEALQSFGYETAVAHDGPAALLLAQTFRPHTALLDIGLPVMDGYELAQRLRAWSGPALTMLAITGYGQETDRHRSREAGFAEHLTKLVDFEKLVRLLERAPADSTP